MILLDTSDDDVSRCMVNDAGESVCAHITVLHWSRGRVPIFRFSTPELTGHLSEGSFVRNGVVQIPKFDANPNPMPTFRTNDTSDK